jgi:hypothetical protein
MLYQKEEEGYFKKKMTKFPAVTTSKRKKKISKK